MWVVLLNEVVIPENPLRPYTRFPWRDLSVAGLRCPGRRLQLLVPPGPSPCQGSLLWRRRVAVCRRCRGPGRWDQLRTGGVAALRLYFPSS